MELVLMYAIIINVSLFEQFNSFEKCYATVKLTQKTFDIFFIDTFVGTDYVPNIIF